ncbi:MAG: SDR family oxidoreductase [Rhizobiaceae bacterium]
MAQPRKTALVTGGARRIGAAIARDLARHGFAVAVHHHGSHAVAEALVDEIGNAGGTAVALAADLRDRTEARTLIDEATGALGPVSLLVNNASLFVNDSLATIDAEIWDGHFAVHVEAPVALTAGMAEALPENETGLVVNMIDQRVWRLTPRFFSYTLSKSALWTATRTMAQALAPRIRVNAIGPGPALPNERQSAEDFKRQAEAVPLGRGPALDEFGATIQWLWETPSVTGQMIALDGGQHLAWQTPDVTGARE